jgi:ribonuclease P/MRP protein subunit POP5
MVRFKNRYALVDVRFNDGLTDPTVTERDLVNAVRKTITQAFGLCGSSGFGGSFSVKYYAPSTGTAILRVARSDHQKFIAALSLTTSIKDRACMLRVLHISGSMRNCQRVAIEQSRKQVLFVRRTLADLGQKKAGDIASQKKLLETIQEALGRQLADVASLTEA